MSADAGAGEPSLPATAGALLTAAREAAGLTIDAVAQQLKLAPRQVRALEEGDYTHLPGRTFVRGFVRNYARLVRLEPERVLRALPAGASEAALEAPALQQTAPTIGELPTTDYSKSGWARWAIPVTLAAIVAAAAVYEWLRPADGVRTPVVKDAPVASQRPAPSPAAPGTPLPNPLGTGTTLPDAAPAPAGSSAPDTGSAATPVATPATAPAATSGAAPADTPATAAAAASGAAGGPALVLAFRDFSWTEVRDRDGKVLLSRMNPGGTAQTLSGAPPLELVIGNATDVSVSYRGRPVDLAPHTRQNVARFTLP